MRQNILGMKTVLTAFLLMGAVLLLWQGTVFAAAPTLGDGCGVEASIVGSDLAGKVTMGTDLATCTLTFASTFPNAPACTAVNETSRGGLAAPVGVRSTTTTLVFDGTAPIYDGDVVSYLCVGY